MLCYKKAWLVSLVVILLVKDGFSQFNFFDKGKCSSHCTKRTSSLLRTRRASGLSNLPLYCIVLYPKMVTCEDFVTTTSVRPVTTKNPISTTLMTFISTSVTPQTGTSSSTPSTLPGPTQTTMVSLSPASSTTIASTDTSTTMVTSDTSTSMATSDTSTTMATSDTSTTMATSDTSTAMASMSPSCPTSSTPEFIQENSNETSTTTMSATQTSSTTITMNATPKLSTMTPC